MRLKKGRMCMMAALLCLFSIVSGCSLQYVDKNGARHVWGLTHTVTRDARKDRSEVVAQQVTTLGVAVLVLPEQSGISVGYTRNFTVQVSTADPAGKINYSLHNPTDFQFKDFRTILREVQ